MTNQSPPLRPADGDGRRVQEFARIERAEMTPDQNPAMRALHRARREAATPVTMAERLARHDHDL